MPSRRGRAATNDSPPDEVIRVIRLQKGKARAIDVDEDSDEADTTPPPHVPDSEPAQSEPDDDVLARDDEDDESDVDMGHALDKTTRKKRKSKKDIPLGRNGLKKRRVMRSRSTVDAKGYMGAWSIHRYDSTALICLLQSRRTTRPTSPCPRMRKSSSESLLKPRKRRRMKTKAHKLSTPPTHSPG